MSTTQLTYAQLYYKKLQAKKLGISLEEYLLLKGKETTIINKSTEPKQMPSFDKVKSLSEINVNDRMLVTHKSGLVIDKLISYESGIPVGTNIMCTGDPGVGKTTVLLHTIAHLQKQNPTLKCLFISCEMMRTQMFKYMQRFPVFGCVKTLFSNDFTQYNMKDVMEQILQEGYDYVLIDSIAEVLESVKEDCGMSFKEAEKWLIDLCQRNNEGENDRDVYTSFLLIQQVTKNGTFTGSNKLKHLTDGHMEMRREKMSDGGGTYMVFSKNRNGQSDMKWSYQLTSNDIHYGYVVDEETEDEEIEIVEIKPKREFKLNVVASN
jgi:predicted ATP-dependent serine protease